MAIENRDMKTSSSATTRRAKSTGKTDVAQNIIGALGGGDVRHYVASAVEKKLRNVDVDGGMDQVMTVATSSFRAMKRYSKNNPNLFWSGVAALAIGAGLIAGAARTKEEELVVEFEPEMDI